MESFARRRAGRKPVQGVVSSRSCAIAAAAAHDGVPTVDWLEPRRPLTTVYSPQTGAATITLSQTGDSTAGPSGLGIDSKITIRGPTSGNGITISGGDSQRLFYVASTGTLSLDDLTITGDSAGNHGGPNDGSSVTD